MWLEVRVNVYLGFVIYGWFYGIYVQGIGRSRGVGESERRRVEGGDVDDNRGGQIIGILQVKWFEFNFKENGKLLEGFRKGNSMI